MKPFVKSLLLVGILACALFWAFSKSILPGLAGSSNASARLSGRNVVVILIDTLRADHLPFYGYSKNTAPFLNELANQSTLFERAFATCSSTAPSTSSLFTSLYPSQHGVITGFFATSKLQKDHQNIALNRIPEHLHTITEYFKDAGYRTFSVADNLNISTALGYDQGFDYFETTRDEGADVVNAKILEWEDTIKNSSPYFLYIHYMDPHAPYKRHEPWYQEDSDAMQRLRNAYDSEISFVDERIQQLFERFAWEKDSVVLVLADHGEEFGEHGDKGHGKNLYRESIHIPLFLYIPGDEPRRVSDSVSLIDVLPTLAELFGFPSNAAWQGQSLLRLLDGTADSRSVASELLRPPEHNRAAVRSVVFDNNWHFIETMPKNGPKAEELYDLAADFTERHNRLTSDREMADRGRLELEQVVEEEKIQSKDAIDVSFDKDTLEQLRTLGYVE